MKILMTGATGLLGLNTVPQLLEAGHEVVAVVRKPDTARKLLGEHPGLSFVQGDLDRIEDMVPHLAGCDAVVHAAALFTEYYATGADWDRFYELNVLGTQTLFRAARTAGVGRGVFVSSVGVMAAPDGRRIPPEKMTDFYRRSKIEAEIVLEGDEELRDWPLITLRPGWIWGPNDPAPTSTGAMTRNLIEKGSEMLPTGDVVAMVDARDVGKAILSALIIPARTATYPVVGAEIRSIDALRAVASHIPRARAKTVPVGAALFLSRVMDWKVKVFGGKNPIPMEGVKFIAGPLTANMTQSHRDLGVVYRPFEETAKDVAEYWLERLGKKG